MSLAFVFWKYFHRVAEMFGKKMCLDCQDFIPKQSKILDLGCGSGIISEIFGNYFQSEVRGVDVEDWRIKEIPFQEIDGVNLPFKENEFDVTLINYVLHHSLNPIGLLKEAKRVTKDKIVIYEDLPEGFFSKLSNKLHSFLTLLLHRGASKPVFKKRKEWLKVFEDLGLKVVFEKNKGKFPVKRHLFILRV